MSRPKALWWCPTGCGKRMHNLGKGKFRCPVCVHHFSLAQAAELNPKLAVYDRVRLEKRLVTKKYKNVGLVCAAVARQQKGHPRFEAEYMT